MLLLTVLAQTDGADPVNLVQFGVLGVILTLILFGFLWAKPSVDRLIKDKERAEAQRDAMVEVYEKEIIPILGAVNARVLEVVPLLAEVQRLLSEQQRTQREN